MVEQRTAAQVAQDQNKAKDGKFQHNVNAESTGVVLAPEDERYDFFDHVNQQVTPGTSVMSSVQYMTKTMAVDMYVNNLGAAVKKQYPDADRIEYRFHDDVEYGGSTATFVALRDKEGNEIAGDPALFGEDGSALSDAVDADELQEKLTYLGEDEDGWNIAAIKLDEVKQSAGEALRFEAEDYVAKLEKVQAKLNAQKAQAQVAVLGHVVSEKMPDIEEFELAYGMSGGVRISKVTTKAGKFTNPSASEPGSAGFINWDWLNAQTSLEDFDESVMYRPIKMSDATSWRAGNRI